ncbi:hypothetical protein M427DRAFT_394685, partial [Gonapodya prolifera JEL478]
VLSSSCPTHISHLRPSRPRPRTGPPDTLHCCHHPTPPGTSAPPPRTARGACVLVERGEGGRREVWMWAGGAAEGNKAVEDAAWWVVHCGGGGETLVWKRVLPTGQDSPSATPALVPAPAPAPAPRFGHALVAVGTKIWVVGGVEGELTTNTSTSAGPGRNEVKARKDESVVWVWDTEGLTWSAVRTKGAAPAARSGHVTVGVVLASARTSPRITEPPPTSAPPKTDTHTDTFSDPTHTQVVGDSSLHSPSTSREQPTETAPTMSPTATPPVPEPATDAAPDTSSTPTHILIHGGLSLSPTPYALSDAHVLHLETLTWSPVSFTTRAPSSSRRGSRGRAQQQEKEQERAFGGRLDHGAVCVGGGHGQGARMIFVGGMDTSGVYNDMWSVEVQ